MDIYNGHFNSPKLVYCLLIIFLGVLTAPGLADWEESHPSEILGVGSNPSGNYTHPCLTVFLFYKNYSTSVTHLISAEPKVNHINFKSSIYHLNSGSAKIQTLSFLMVL